MDIPERRPPRCPGSHPDDPRGARARRLPRRVLGAGRRRCVAAHPRAGRRRRPGAGGHVHQQRGQPRARTARARDLPGGVPGPHAGRGAGAAVAPVVGRKGEYARATSTIVDAFLHQIMYHGLGTLELNLPAGYLKPMLVNHNSGGMAQLNSTDALQTVHSGPVSGIAASEYRRPRPSWAMWWPPTWAAPASTSASGAGRAEVL